MLALEAPLHATYTATERYFILYSQRTESLKFKTESVLKKYLIVPAYLNFRNDLNVVLNFSVDIIRFRRQKLHT